MHHLGSDPAARSLSQVVVEDTVARVDEAAILAYVGGVIQIETLVAVIAHDRLADVGGTAEDTRQTIVAPIVEPRTITQLAEHLNRQRLDGALHRLAVVLAGIDDLDADRRVLAEVDAKVGAVDVGDAVELDEIRGQRIQVSPEPIGVAISVHVDELSIGVHQRRLNRNRVPFVVDAGHEDSQNVLGGHQRLDLVGNRRERGQADRVARVLFAKSVEARQRGMAAGHEPCGITRLVHPQNRALSDDQGVGADIVAVVAVDVDEQRLRGHARKLQGGTELSVGDVVVAPNLGARITTGVTNEHHRVEVGAVVDGGDLHIGRAAGQVTVHDIQAVAAAASPRRMYVVNARPNIRRRVFDSLAQSVDVDDDIAVVARNRFAEPRRRLAVGQAG